MRRVLIAIGLLTATLPLAVIGSRPADTPIGFDATRLAAEIPEPMLGAYLDAAEAWDIDWALLAAIGKLECDHFRSQLAGCWPPGTVNHAGARGPMQFLGSTWRADADTHQLDVAGPPPPPGRGYGTDGDGDEIADPWNVYDAVHAAARYLVDLGGHDDPRTAAKHYNAGPNNSSPTAGEGYATAVIDLIGHYQLIGGLHGPGSTADTYTPGAATGCTIPDPTGTGGCVTPRTAHLVHQIRHHLGEQPMWCWARRPNNPTSDHPAGRACDITVGAIGRFPTPAERAAGWRTTDWLIDNADPLGITYIIWDGRIWATRSGWRPYTGGGIYNPNHPTGGHHDHIHISVRSN